MVMWSVDTLPQLFEVILLNCTFFCTPWGYDCFRQLAMLWRCLSTMMWKTSTTKQTTPRKLGEWAGEFDLHQWIFWKCQQMTGPQQTTHETEEKRFQGGVSTQIGRRGSYRWWALSSMPSNQRSVLCRIKLSQTSLSVCFYTYTNLRTCLDWVWECRPDICFFFLHKCTFGLNFSPHESA